MAKNDAREIINQIADYLQANPSGGNSSYLVYTALLRQTGAGAPTATILQNTIGDIIWAREAMGYFEGALAGAFKTNKSWICLTQDGDFSNGLFTNGSVLNDEDTIHVYNSNIQGGSPTAADEMVVYIEIRVYP